MKTVHKTLWKDLKRHPLSTEYRDIAGPQWMRFCLRMKRIGFMKDRPIILHEEQVIDGWQRLRACIETNIEPIFAEMPTDMTPEDFVEAVNDERRHETPEEAAERIEARRKRVAEAVVAGLSKTSIAEQEQVSRPTIDNDIDKIKEESRKNNVEGATPCSLEPPDGKVTGKDGRQQAAKQPTRSALLCERCQHKQEIGRELPKDCQACAEARQEAKKQPEEPPDFDEPAKQDDEIVDDDDTLVPVKLRTIFAEMSLFRSAAAMLAKTAIALERVEKSRAYQFEDRQAANEKGDRRVYSTVCRTAEKKMIGLRPSKVCCGDGCKKCGQKGFFTQDEIEK